MTMMPDYHPPPPPPPTPHPENDEIHNSDSHHHLHQSLLEATRKVTAGLLPRVQQHVDDHVLLKQHVEGGSASNNVNFYDKNRRNSAVGLDFLDVKNTVMISYLVELTWFMRNQLVSARTQQHEEQQQEEQQQQQRMNLQRLTELKTVLDKMRSLDQKLRYQIDKLLAAAAAAASISVTEDTLLVSSPTPRTDTAATTTTTTTRDDPLDYRPNVSSFLDDGSDSNSCDDDDHEYKTYNTGDGELDNCKDDDNEYDGESGWNDIQSPPEDLDGEEDDPDIAAVRMTLALARTNAKNRKSHDDDSNNDYDNGTKYTSRTNTNRTNDSNAAALYRAPRLASVPYTADHVDRQAEQEKRRLKRLRASEIAVALRLQYQDTPEVDDARGGAELGKQREASRRLAAHDADRTKYEESTMIRLTHTRKEKKERKRLMRLESSNLSAIADVDNLVRGLDEPNRSKQDKRRDDSLGHDPAEGRSRFSNGKRKRPSDCGRKSSFKSANALQATLFGEGQQNKKKKKNLGR